MLMREDVEDDLMESYAHLYKKEGSVLIYQNGQYGSRYMVEVKVWRLGIEDL